jgi:hypothetical protein
MLPEIVIPKEKKLKLKDILEQHDIALFREFCIDEADLDVSRWAKDKLSRFMHVLKARQVHFGGIGQMSRNFLRQEALDRVPEKWSKDLLSLDYIPLCNECKWFREGPDGEMPCMHLGGTPLDSACAGWTKNQV